MKIEELPPLGQAVSDNGPVKCSNCQKDAQCVNAHGRHSCFNCAIAPFLKHVHPLFIQAWLAPPHFNAKEVIAQFGRQAAITIISSTGIEHSIIKAREQVEQVRIHQCGGHEMLQPDRPHSVKSRSISAKKPSYSRRFDEIHQKAARKSTGCYWCGALSEAERGYPLERDTAFTVPFNHDHGYVSNAARLHFYECASRIEIIVLACHQCNTQRGYRSRAARFMFEAVLKGQARLVFKRTTQPENDIKQPNLI